MTLGYILQACGHAVEELSTDALHYSNLRQNSERNCEMRQSARFTCRGLNKFGRDNLKTNSFRLRDNLVHNFVCNHGQVHSRSLEVVLDFAAQCLFYFTIHYHRKVMSALHPEKYIHFNRKTYVFQV